MPHSIVYHSEAHVIESKIDGDVTLSEVKAIISEFAVIVKEKRCALILANYSDATIKLSTLEIYEAPQIYADIFASSGLSAHQLKRALVIAADPKDFLFYETVTTNRGQRVKVFQDAAAAKA